MASSCHSLLDSALQPLKSSPKKSCPHQTQQWSSVQMWLKKQQSSGPEQWQCHNVSQLQCTGPTERSSGRRNFHLRIQSQSTNLVNTSNCKNKCRQKMNVYTTRRMLTAITNHWAYLWSQFFLVLCLLTVISEVVKLTQAATAYQSESSSSSSDLVELKFSVSEGVPVGTYIGVIRYTNGTLPVEPPFLIVPVPGGEYQQPQYIPPNAIANSGNSPSASSVDTDLNIDQSTGEIRTAVELDREQRSHYSFIAISLSGINIHVKIMIEDVNDNAPQFPTREIELEFPENSKPRDVKRTLPPARDADRGIFGTQSYRIVSGNIDNAFRLVSHREKDDILYLDLQVNGVLDRENIAHYQLVIEAFDGGQPPLKDQMTVQINILDHNDCEPTFNQNHYYGSVAENATIDSQVLKVTATDSDQGENGLIVYSLHMKHSPGGASSAPTSSYFTIDHHTGWIKVAKPLDFEAQELHELVVIARDQGAQPLETSALVSIRVTDVHDRQPTIDLLYLTANSKPEIFEDAKVGDLIARVSINDGQLSGESSFRRTSASSTSLPSSSTMKRFHHTQSRISVSLLGAGTEFGLRTQDHIFYLIVVTGKLDREKRAKYSLTVSVTDRSFFPTPLNTSTVFELEVLDVNDNAPYFESAEYHTTLPEAVDIGSSVFQMNAIDIDSDSILSYAFVLSRNEFNAAELELVADNDRRAASEQWYFMAQFNQNNLTHRLSTFTKWFSIDPRSGLIVTRTQVDCEVDSQPKLTVLVTDANPYAAPVNAGNYRNSNLSRSLTNNSALSGFTATTTLVVAISDINDNEPIFDQSFYNVTVSEDGAVGVCILNISATDPDCGLNALVNYTFATNNLLPYLYHSASATTLPALSTSASTLAASSSNFGRYRAKYISSTVSSSLDSSQNAMATATTTFGNQRLTDFSLDPKSGQLCVLRPLDYERTSVYDIPVLATDRGGLSTTAMIKIQVLDINDNYPVFYPREYKVNVLENAFNGHRVPLVIVAATDLDSPSHPNGQISYEIQSGNEQGFFVVDHQTGELFLVKPFTLGSVEQQFRLNLVARDGGGLESKESAIVQISVLPADSDSKIGMPLFVQRQFAFQVIENVAQGAVVGTVRAKVDKTQSSEQTISYAIYSGDPDGYFTIDPRSGTISTKSINIDREKYSHLMLNVQAYTGQYPGPYRYAHTQVNITILDENDNVPLFPSSSLKISIPENAPVSENSIPVFVAYAIDYDSGKFGEVRYSLHRADNQLHGSMDQDFPFVIEPKSGQVRLRRSLDYEIRNEYRLRVVAIDGGNLSSEMIVDVYVQDANDNAPTFVGTAQTIDLTKLLIKKSGTKLNRHQSEMVSLFKVNVPESAAVNSHFYQIKATDADTGNHARLTYSLETLDTKSNFNVPVDIFPNNGILYVRDAFDRESVDQYELLISVHDHGTPQQLNATAVLQITVTDINDNRPYWKQNLYTFEVPEDTSIGSLLGQVIAFDVDLGNNSSLVYNISDTNDGGFFRINPSTGQIYLRSNLDRELKDRYDFTVEVRDQGIPQSLSADEKAIVTIIVLDINDNRPTFDFIDGAEQDFEEENNVNIVKVPLGVARKSTVVTFRASDPDAGENGTVQYFLIEPNEIFELNQDTGALITKVDIKESIRSKHQMEKISLVASDGQGKKSKVKVVEMHFVDKHIIHQVDLDKVPSFDFVILQSVGNAKQEQHVGYGYRVGSIDVPTQHFSRKQVSQPYCGNRMFSYFGRQLKDGLPFFLDSDEDNPTKMNLMLIDSLNQSNVHNQYHLLMCVDWAQCSVTLMHNYQKQPNAAHQSSGSIKHQQLTQCDHYAKVNIQVKRAVNYDCNPFPLDNIDMYEVKIPWLGSDSGSTSAGSTKKRVNDLLFLNQSSCDDQVHYELFSPIISSSELSRLFSITPSLSTSAGSILQFRPYEKSLIHRYLHQDFMLSLTARWKIIDVDDQSTTIEMVQSVPIRVKILSSDNQIGNIVFVNEKFFELEEDCCRVGAAIVQARINISHDDFRIRYFLGSYGDQHLVSNDEQFTLNPETGLLMLKRELDYERKHEHRINITAVVYDSKSPIMSVSHVVKIRLINTNDESPVFVRRSHIKEVLETAKQGILLTQLEAKDNDQPLQANITYVLATGYQYADYFQLNSRNGELKLLKSLDREEIEQFQVPVYAFDEDFKHYAFTLVHVKVLDVNDNPPYFIQQNYELRVPESVTPGTVIHNVIALDPDQSSRDGNYSGLSSNGLLYRILSGNQANKFVLHPNRGELSTNSQLDREMQSTYQLVVEVTDSFYTATCNLTIELTDVNDNAPVFDKSDYYAILDLEGTFGWLHLITVRAIDSDGDKLLYTIDTSQSATNEQVNLVNNLTRYFTINSETGEISVHRSLVGPIFELAKSNQLSFEVVAIEAGKFAYRSHQSRAKVHLTLVNDGRTGIGQYNSIPIDSTRFKLSKYPYLIIADSPRDSFRVGQEIGTIELVTGKSTRSKYNSGQVLYQVINGGESYRSFQDYFHLDHQNGLITVKRSLNYNYYEAIVEVNQTSNEPLFNSALSTRTLVQIFIGGIDERKFIKSVNLNSVSIAENEPVGSEITKLASYLHHSHHHLKNKYRFMLAYSNLAEYLNFFELDPYSGVLKLRRQLDYETQPSRIEVIAFAYQSSGSIHEYGYMYNLTIELVNVDDNRAQFTQRHYVGTISEGDPTGSYVTRVNAIDIDEVNGTVSMLVLSSEPRYSYFIVDGNDDNAFSIDQDGVVRTNIVLDREIHERYRLKIIATDMKQHQLTARWSAASFLSDEANYQHLTQCTVEAIVIDQNDNEPVFPPYREISVSEDAQVGSVVATWTANDVDIFPTLNYNKRKSTLNNSSLQSMLEDMFEIGLYTGRIFLKWPLSYLTQLWSGPADDLVRTVRLSISASDQIHTVNTEINVNIKRNHSTMVPRFKKTLSDNNFYLKLNLDTEHSNLQYDVNIEVFRVPLWNDVHTSRKIVYHLENRSPEHNHVGSFFYIDQYRGIIFNNRTMRSVRATKLFHLAIVARYEDSERTVQASLLINIERNLISPLGYHGFYYKKDLHSSTNSLSTSSTIINGQQNHYSLEIENSQIGIPLLWLPKLPLDSYAIVSGNTNKNFLILRGNELVLVSRPLTDQYTLKIKPMRSTSANRRNGNNTVLVNIKVKASSAVDAVNSSPFKSSVFVIEISESEKVDTEIQTLKTSVAENYRFEFFSGNEEEAFRVEQYSGALIVNRKLDFEKLSSYRLGIMARNEILDQTYLAVVNINLLNANEYCPRFPSAQFKAIVDENAPPGTKVIPIKAIDQDRDMLNYTLIKLASSVETSDASEPFRYDPESGYLVTTGQLDLEENMLHHQSAGSLAVYKYIVRVSDSSANIYSADSVSDGLQCGSVEALLEVQLGSVDEFSPQFSSESYQFKVTAPSSSDSFTARSRLKVGQVLAHDLDSGPDGTVYYSIKNMSPASMLDLVQINSTSGLITMSLTRMKKKLTLKKNALPKLFSFIVSASSGRANSLHSLAMVDVQLTFLDLASGFLDITEDEDVEEINSIDSDLSRSSMPEQHKEASLPGWAIFSLVLMLLLVMVLVVSIMVIRLHQAQQQQLLSGNFGRSASNVGSLFRKIGPLVGGSGTINTANGLDPNGMSPAYSATHYGTTNSVLPNPPCYNDATLGTANVLMSTNLSLGHSASSGRGSAEDDDADLDDVDEEIRMINESSHYYTEGPDSGGEEITSTAEYLARLGVSNHYEEEQENTSSIAIDDDDDESTDVLSEMGGGKLNPRYGNTAKKLRSRMGSSISTTGTIVQNSRNGSEQWSSLNSIIQHNEEELTGSYNWDYLQHWGPKYQPLSSVFAEIARLKSTDPNVQFNPDLIESLSNRSSHSNVSSSRTRSGRQSTATPQQMAQSQTVPPIFQPKPNQSVPQQFGPMPIQAQVYYGQQQSYGQNTLAQSQTLSSSVANYSIYGSAVANVMPPSTSNLITSSVAAAPAMANSGSSPASSIYNR